MNPAKSSLKELLLVLFLAISLYIIIFNKPFFSGLLHGTDLDVPAPISKYYWWLLWFPVHPMRMGTRGFPFLKELLLGLVVFFSNGNRILAERIVLGVPVISFVSMYFLSRRHSCCDKLTALAVSGVYAYSPLFVSHWPIAFLWGYAFMPLMLNIFLDIMKLLGTNNWKIRGIKAGLLKKVLLLESVLALIMSYLYQVFFLILLLQLVIIIVFILVDKGTPLFSRFIRLCKGITLLGSVVLLLPLFSFTMQMLLSKYFSSYTSVTGMLKDVRISDFYGASLTIQNVIRLTGLDGNRLERYGLLYNNPIGYILPILVFLGLFSIMIKWRKRSLTFSDKFYISMLINSVLLITLTQIVVPLENFLLTLNIDFLLIPLILMRSPNKIMMMLSLTYSCCIAYSLMEMYLFFNGVSVLTKMRWTVQKHPLRIILNFKVSKAENFRTQVTSVSLLILVAGYLMYAPITSDEWQRDQYTVAPQELEDLHDFLNQREDGRTLVTPLYNQIQSDMKFYHPLVVMSTIVADPWTADYVGTLFSLVDEKTNYALIPYVLRLGGAKYVMIHPDFSKDPLLGWRMAGPVRYEGGYLWGSPDSYFNYFSQLDDFKQMDLNASWTVLENEQYSGYVSIFNNNGLVVGDPINFFKNINIINSTIKGEAFSTAITFLSVQDDLASIPQSLTEKSTLIFLPKINQSEGIDTATLTAITNAKQSIHIMGNESITTSHETTVQTLFNGSKFNDVSFSGEVQSTNISFSDDFVSIEGFSRYKASRVAAHLNFNEVLDLRTATSISILMRSTTEQVRIGLFNENGQEIKIQSMLFGSVKLEVPVNQWTEITIDIPLDVIKQLGNISRIVFYECTRIDGDWILDAYARIDIKHVKVKINLGEKSIIRIEDWLASLLGENYKVYLKYRIQKNITNVIREIKTNSGVINFTKVLNEQSIYGLKNTNDYVVEINHPELLYSKNITFFTQYYTQGILDQMILVINNKINKSDNVRVTYSLEEKNPIKIYSDLKYGFNIDVDTSASSQNINITIPIFFASSYNNGWKMKLKIQGNGTISSIEHSKGFIYGNLYNIMLQINHDTNNIRIDGKIYFDNIQLIIYRLRTWGTIMVFFSGFLVNIDWANIWSKMLLTRSYMKRLRKQGSQDDAARADSIIRFSD